MNADLKPTLRALVDALPKCSVCGELATMQFLGADNDVDYTCRPHATFGSERPVAWAGPLADALRALG